MNGKGIYYYPDGSIFCGQWKNNKANGLGIYIFDKDITWGGTFENNLL